MFAERRLTQFLYQNPPNLPGTGIFSVPPHRSQRYNVLLGKDLDFP
jgi:hypothetical protein